MKTSDQGRRFLSSLPLLAVSVISAGAHAEEKIEYLNFDRVNVPRYIKTFDAKTFESKKYSKGFKIKGWRISHDVYMGSVKVAGEYGPGMVVDHGNYVWGFNHQRIEFQLRF